MVNFCAFSFIQFALKDLKFPVLFPIGSPMFQNASGHLQGRLQTGYPPIVPVPAGRVAIYLFGITNGHQSGILLYQAANLFCTSASWYGSISIKAASCLINRRRNLRNKRDENGVASSIASGNPGSNRGGGINGAENVAAKNP